MADVRYIYSSFFPMRGFKAVALWRWIVVRKEYKGKLAPCDYTHEKIHILQQQEISVMLFSIIYGLEYMVKLLCTFSFRRAYRSVSFEQEAYANETRQSYLVLRRRYAWVKFVTKIKR